MYVSVGGLHNFLTRTDAEIIKIEWEADSSSPLNSN